MESTDWMDDGICRGTRLDFFSEIVTEEMKGICFNCPVEKECFNHAVKYEAYGFWAGTTERDRVAIRINKNLVQPKYLPSDALGRTPSKNELTKKEIEHGTERGYQLHLRRKSRFVDNNNQSCNCQGAHSEFMRQYRLNKGRLA